MLKALSTSFAVGIFNSVYQIVQIFYLVPWTLAVPFFPVFSRLSKSDPEQLHRMLNRLLKITWLITLPLSVWIAFTSHQIIQTIYGGKFSQAGDGLRIIIWTIPFLFPTSFFFSFSPLWENRRPILYASQYP
jgi:O-antigen/teichoic acid export membrane protein